MKRQEHVESPVRDDTQALLQTEEPVLQQLLVGRSVRGAGAAFPGVVVGELIGIVDDGMTPLVRYPGQPGSAAVRARTVVDLHGAHIGRSVVLAFEAGDAALPLVMGVVHPCEGWPLADAPAQLEIDTDGRRMIVDAKEQLVLRCGKASITLTKSGKVLIQGSYVSSRSTGVTRIRGGSVQLN